MVRPLILARAADPARTRALVAAGAHPLLARLWAARGLEQAGPTEWAALIPPNRLSHVDRAGELLADAIQAGRRLLIVADYDCDGATACAVAVRALRDMGARVDFLVPNRFETGYGLSPAVVELACRHPSGKPDLLDLYVTVPKPLVAPGNGVFVGVTEQGDTRTYHWRAKHPTTYAVSINVGPYRELKGEYRSRYGNTIPLYYWYLPGEEAQARALFAEFPRMLDFFEAKIGPYPWGDEKMGVVETPYEGMEHQTINAYGNHYAQDGNGFDWLLQHEFSHEWFGNQMTNANWDDMWLHEGFATLMQPLYARHLNGDAAYYAWLNRLRMMIANRHPVVSGQPRTEEAVYDDSRGGPGQDIYNKGALMLQTLHHLIGDQAFYDSIRELVYGRPDPKPGNFVPQYRSTADYMRIVNRVTGKDYDWFFKVYLYQAALPKLDAQRHGDTLDLRWEAPAKLPFPMPVDVQVDDAVHTVPMADGHGSLAVPAGALVTIDPHSVLLRDEPRITEFQQWMQQQRRERKAAKP